MTADGRASIDFHTANEQEEEDKCTRKGPERMWREPGGLQLDNYEEKQRLGLGMRECEKRVWGFAPSRGQGRAGERERHHRADPIAFCVARSMRCDAQSQRGRRSARRANPHTMYF